MRRSCKSVLRLACSSSDVRPISFLIIFSIRARSSSVARSIAIRTASAPLGLRKSRTARERSSKIPYRSRRSPPIRRLNDTPDTASAPELPVTALPIASPARGGTSSMTGSRGTPLAGLLARGVDENNPRCQQEVVHGCESTTARKGRRLPLPRRSVGTRVLCLSRLRPPNPGEIPPDLSRSVLSADGMTMQEVLGAAKMRVKSTVGAPVETFEFFPRRAPTPQPDPDSSEYSWLLRLAHRRYPRPMN
jgi:hypothetical protein